MKNKTDINLIFESYIKNKALTEDNDNMHLKMLLKMINLEKLNQKKMSQ